MEAPLNRQHAITSVSLVIAFAGIGLFASRSLAQAPVVGVGNAEALFTSDDPVLHRNKQTAYFILRDLLEAGHWELADRYLTEEYIQHNPLAASGRQAVVDFFTQVLKVKPKPIPETLSIPIVSVIAEGDLVMVATLRVMKDPKDPDKTYTTTWFDVWRFEDGKAAEHWDCATK